MRIDVGRGDDLAALVRADGAESLVIVIATGDSPLWLAEAKAAIAPLAIEQAPGRRINAVVAGSHALAADVAAAVAFLDRAGSTTGQLLAVGVVSAD
jgi:hypothetical protein